MKRNWLLYLVIFSLALNFGTIGTFVYLRYQDQAPKLSQEMPPPLPMRTLWRTLNLDEAQRQAVRGLFSKHRAKVMEIRRELFNKRQGLFDLLKAEEPAMAAIQSEIGEISALQGKLEEELVRHLLEFRSQLKPEQRTAFLELVQTRLDKALGGPCGPLDGRRGLGKGHGSGMRPGPRPAGPGCPE